jgi:hypothetical protein
MYMTQCTKFELIIQIEPYKKKLKLFEIIIMFKDET